MISHKLLTSAEASTIAVAMKNIAASRSTRRENMSTSTQDQRLEQDRDKLFKTFNCEGKLTKSHGIDNRQRPHRFQCCHLLAHRENDFSRNSIFICLISVRYMTQFAVS
ncbi:hypothetical protein Y032_0462g1900 [Ancylostoma ceylanicum]|uniref:Uncharacterized protein n=1 Tax=Ancylostoma ceylanicum TaxID=53326 RepID=A0A016WX72_9BILA|nr:hypothetical protein Y032_0462g1900 [Ancylostoma ceylanicum]